MKNILTLILCSVLLLACQEKSSNKTTAKKEIKSGLIIIDAQKWFIPGHPESVYELWNIKGHNRQAEELIQSMDSVLTWANDKGLPVIVTYEGNDTGSYDLPLELKSNLNPSTTTHYVKQYYGAPKHKEFNSIIEKTEIRNWLIIGAETDVCVYQTVKELLKKGMNVTLIPNAIYSGRNDTTVSLDNLQSFGANIISIKDLDNKTLLFIENDKQVEAPITYENAVLHIFPISDSLMNTAEYRRLDYLKNYAKIIGLPIQEINADSSDLSTSRKTRLIAGNITESNYLKIKNSTSDELVIISDCTPTFSSINQNSSPRKQTLKMIFYELMETAEFYSKTPDELTGWQKKLKIALITEKLPYVESLQNL